MRGVGTKLPIIVHVQGERCLLGGKVVKKGQNHVYVVIKWPLVAPILLLKLNCGVSKCHAHRIRLILNFILGICDLILEHIGMKVNVNFRCPFGIVANQP